MRENVDSASEEVAQDRKKYTPPHLICYGEVAKITKMKGGLRSDGSSHNTKV